MDIKNDKQIDRYNLEKESAKQPSLLYDYSRELADSEKELEQLKNNHKVIVADISYECYKTGKTKDGAKATKDAVTAVVDSSPEVIKSLQAIADTQYEVKLVKAAVSAIEAKKTALTNLVKLQLAGYYNELTSGSKTDQTSDAMLRHLNAED